MRINLDLYMYAHIRKPALIIIILCNGKNRSASSINLATSLTTLFIINNILQLFFYE